MGAQKVPLDVGVVTLLLDRIRQGDRAAEAELLPVVYRELRAVARYQMGRERSDHTLQPTALVNEAYLRLFRQGQGLRVADRHQFFALAAAVMRRILVDHARGHRATKRGGGQSRLDIEICDLGSESKPVDVLALDQALERLEKFSPRSSRIIELHFFGGFTIDDTAAILGISTRTAKRDWSVARTWLYKEIYGDPAAVGSHL